MMREAVSFVVTLPLPRVTVPVPKMLRLPLRLIVPPAWRRSIPGS